MISMQKIDNKKLSVIFAGCARNCESYLVRSLENINHYSNLFKESFQIIIENGSNDKTREILKNNNSKKNYYIFDDSLNKIQVRTLRLEKARNLIIDKIKKIEELRKCDLLIIVDLDDLGIYKIDEISLIKSLNFLFSKKSIGAVFANQLGTYYDMWALRDHKSYKTDFWVEILQAISKKINIKDNISHDILNDVKKNIIDKKTFSIDKNSSPILVNSAFGGFGIYKMENVLKNKNKYEGMQIINISSKDRDNLKLKYQKCEHVNFNKGLIDQDLELYILPYLINRDFVKNIFPPEAALRLIIKN